jgi:hypothetical protein
MNEVSGVTPFDAGWTPGLRRRAQTRESMKPIKERSDSATFDQSFRPLAKFERPGSGGGARFGGSRSFFENNQTIKGPRRTLRPTTESVESSSCEWALSPPIVPQTSPCYDPREPSLPNGKDIR